jgi:hypothetical protein
MVLFHQIQDPRRRAHGKRRIGQRVTNVRSGREKQNPAFGSRFLTQESERNRKTGNDIRLEKGLRKENANQWGSPDRQPLPLEPDYNAIV